MTTIRVIDLEQATGDGPPDDGVCELGWCDLAVTQRDLLGEPYDWDVVGADDGLCGLLVDPGCPITPGTSAIHHIVDEDLRDAWRWPGPWYRQPPPRGPTGTTLPLVAYAAHNTKAERTWIADDLTEGRPWICTWKCACRLWPEAPLHSNQGLRYWLRGQGRLDGLQRERAAPAHRAGPDAYVTAFLLRELLRDARDQGFKWQDLVAWSAQPTLLPRVPFGENRGKPWSEVDDGLLEWTLGKDFDDDVLFTVRHEMARRERAAFEQTVSDTDERG